MKGLKERVVAFRGFELPGQPMIGHMGTNYLISDLAKEVERLEADRDTLEVKNTVLQNDLNTALAMLAGWCVAIHDEDSPRDQRDERYKDAMFRDGPLRGILDKAIEKHREMCK